MSQTTNVYQKIQAIRAELTKLNLKKSGENKFAKYKYYELGDFLPELNKLMDKHGIMSRFTLTEDRGVLTIFNVDKPEEQVVFHTHTVVPAVKGANEIQNIGSQITYTRRYLLMIAFEIAESDAVDAQKPTDKVELADKYVKRIKSAQTAEELAIISKEIILVVGEKYRQSLTEHYTKRKDELNEIA